jgi:hypothetical protein
MKHMTQWMQKRTNFFAVAASSAAIATALSGCSSGPGESESNMTSFTSAETKADSAELFNVPKEQMARVEIVTAEKGPLPRTLRLAGAVAYNAFETTPVFAAIGGPVREIRLPGQFAQGDSRFSRLPALIIPWRGPPTSKRGMRLLDRKALYASARSLCPRRHLGGRSAAGGIQPHPGSCGHGIVGRRAAGARCERSEALIKNVSSTAEVPVLAPVTGEIVERLWVPASCCNRRDAVFYDFEHQHGVVVVNVYQNDLPYVHIDAVEVNTDSYPELFHGKISYLAPALDPNTRTLQARIVTQNPGKKLKKDMYVTALVKAGSIPEAITVADAAILRDKENQTFVYVQVNANQFARRVVTIGQTNQGRTQVTSGLKEGEHVVGAGALFLQFKNSIQH